MLQNKLEPVRRETYVIDLVEDQEDVFTDGFNLLVEKREYAISAVSALSHLIV